MGVHMSLGYACYYTFLALVCLERLVELVLSTRNAAWSRARGGVEFGRGHFPPMVALHTALLLGCALEPMLAHRTFVPWLGWPMLAVALAAQGLRWWCVATLGPRWNTRVIAVPGLPLVDRGPYRWIKHPNYLAVVIEGIALPLAGSAWITGVVFTLLDAIVLTVRIRCEDQALLLTESGREGMASGQVEAPAESALMAPGLTKSRAADSSAVDSVTGVVGASDVGANGTAGVLSIGGTSSAQTAATVPDDGVAEATA